MLPSCPGHLWRVWTCNEAADNCNVRIQGKALRGFYTYLHDVEDVDSLPPMDVSVAIATSAQECGGPVLHTTHMDVGIAAHVMWKERGAVTENCSVLDEGKVVLP